MKDIVWLSEIDKNDVSIVGGKGANLGELYKIGAPVPNGFIITADAYFKAVRGEGAMDKIKGILFNLDVGNPTLLASKAKECQKEICAIKIDRKLESSIVSYYKKLTQDGKKYVAVRSSATAEDLPEASFAGQQSTFLNVSGVVDLKRAILEAWASLFEARAIFYRTEKNFDHFKVGIALPIQLMIESETSGIMFTVDPVTSDKKTIIIEAIYGLGELIVGGQINPDHYKIDKENLSISAKNIVSQEVQLVRVKKLNKKVPISKPYRKAQKLPDEKIIELAKIGKIIEKHYFWPQDIEWAYAGGKIYIVQTRPVTTIDISGDKLKTAISKESQFGNREIILQGSGASPVIGSGPVILIKSPKGLDRVQKGMVLVTEMTNPDFVPAMKKASAIITDKGGRTSHAAIISRELGIACVVGSQNATKKLKDGMIVTVDGRNGTIYKGGILNEKKTIYNASLEDQKRPFGKTATKLYVNLAEPELAGEIAAKNVDGVGLLRAEFILAQIGKHPKKFVEEKKQGEFIEKLSGYLEIIARSFGERPVIYRATNLKTNEYRNLAGGEKFEPKESNPMLGYRGAFRYIKDPDVFKLELEAIKKVRKQHENLHLMIPFVRSPKELQSVRELVDATGFFENKNFKFWMMAEIPVNVINLTEFIKVGIDGISIGSNDLTMMLLGTDRDNEEVASEFNEMDSSVLWAFERLIKTAAKAGISSSICGQAPSVYPDLTEKLVSWGITSISVNPDSIGFTRDIIYEAEHKLLKNH